MERLHNNTIHINNNKHILIPIHNIQYKHKQLQKNRNTTNDNHRNTIKHNNKKKLE